MANPNWTKGRSGNPAGRPPKKRALTELLEKAGKVKIAVKDENGNEVEVPRRELVAAKVWEVAATGKTKLDEREVFFSQADWLDAVEFIYKQIDGPPRQEIDMTTQGQKINGTLTEDERIARIATLLDRARARRTGQTTNDAS